MTSPTLLFLGLEGLDASVIHAGVRDGSLANLGRLIEQSRWRQIDAPVGLGSDATWSSFNSGLNPGKVGRYFVRQVKPGSYRSEYLTEADVHGEPFWEWAARDGMKVAAIDMPYAAARPTNGIVVADWRVHDSLYHHVTTTAPTALAAQLHDRFGSDPVGTSDRPGVRTARQLVALRDGLLAKNEHKRRYVADLITNGDFDLIAVAFTDGHCAGHQMWHLHEPLSSADHAMADSIGDPMLEVYKAVDQAVGELVDLVGPSTNIVAFTGPGMGYNYTASHILDDVLRRLEPEMVAPNRRAIDPIRRAYRSAVPPRLRARLRSRADDFDETVLARSRRNRRFYSVPSNEIAGAIQFNVVGRDPHGLVERRNIAPLVDELSKALHDLRNIETGTPIVASVHNTADLYAGPYLDWLPDALVVWNRNAPVRGVRSAKTGDIWRPYQGNRTGDHNDQCLAIARGPGLGSGEITESFGTVDIVASMASMAGFSAPECTDGSIIPAFTATSDQ